MKIKISSIFLLLFFIVSKYSFAAIPPPPSQETLNKLKELGDQNLQKYGDGGVTLTPTQIPTKIPTPTKTVTPTPTSKITVIKKILSFNLANYVKGFILNLFGSKK